MYHSISTKVITTYANDGDNGILQTELVSVVLKWVTNFPMILNWQSMPCPKKMTIIINTKKQLQGFILSMMIGIIFAQILIPYPRGKEYHGDF